MAHELATMVDGRTAMAFIGDRSQIWHGLGQELTPDSPLDVWATEAGFDWTIQESPVTFNTPDAQGIHFPGKQVLYRSDTKAPLSVVSMDYKIVQPAEVLEFFADLVGVGGMTLSTAGVLFDGKRFWAMADTGKAGAIRGNDQIKGNLLLTTSCDGTLATNAMFTAVRTVCNNTLRLALESENYGRVRVTHARTFDPANIKDQLGLIDHSWEKFMHNVTKMEATKIDMAKARSFVYDLVAKPNVVAEDQPYTTAAKVTDILARFQSGMGNQGKTAWDLLNGITEYVDHSTGKTRMLDRKLWNTWFGADATMKDKAYEQIMELV